MPEENTLFDLGCQGRRNPHGRLLLPGVAVEHMRPFRIVAKLERCEEAVRDKLLVNCHHEFAAVAGDQLAACVVYAGPMRLRADGQPDRRGPAVEQATSGFKSEAAALHFDRPVR